jgi:hypothetical protein
MVMRLQRNSTLLLGISMAITIAALLFAPLSAPWPKVLEGAVYVLFAAMLASYQPIRSVLTAIPTPQRILLYSMAVVLVVTQLRNRPHESFPLIPWNMYNMRFSGNPQYLEYVGICADGKEVIIPVGTVFHSQERAVLWRLHMLWKQMDASASDAELQQLTDQFQMVLKSVVTRFNQQHPATDVVRVRVMECSLPQPAPGRKLDVTRQMLKEYVL